MSAMSVMSVMVAIAVAGPVVPLTAHAGALPLLLKKKKSKSKDGLTPEQAAERRLPIQDQGRQMVAAGELTAATILYDSAAQTQGDPILFLDAGDAHLSIADEERDIAAAETAKMRAQTAQDILYFQLDSASDPDYQLVEDSDVSGLLARAGTLIDEADRLIAEIQAEQEALLAPQEPTKKPKGSGRGLRLAGYGLTALGVAGLGAGVAGLVIGRINQNRVDDRTVYGPAFDEFDAKGRRGNVIAGVGLAVGGVALAVGVTLVIIGHRRKAASPAGAGDDASPAADEDPSLAIVPTGRGLALTGRF
ncbi:MAG: hypothetical protein KDK70_28245 [Myxococcales bacterium]|nr:hypothetical protein [Myxococcales bacterium]